MKKKIFIFTSIILLVVAVILAVYLIGLKDSVKYSEEPTNLLVYEKNDDMYLSFDFRGKRYSFNINEYVFYKVEGDISQEGIANVDKHFSYSSTVNIVYLVYRDGFLKTRVLLSEENAVIYVTYKSEESLPDLLGCVELSQEEYDKVMMSHSLTADKGRAEGITKYFIDNLVY